MLPSLNRGQENTLQRLHTAINLFLAIYKLVQEVAGTLFKLVILPALQKEKMHGKLIAQFMLFCSAYGAYYEVLQQKV